MISPRRQLRAIVVLALSSSAGCSGWTRQNERPPLHEVGSTHTEEVPAREVDFPNFAPSLGFVQPTDGPWGSLKWKITGDVLSFSNYKPPPERMAAISTHNTTALFEFLPQQPSSWPLESYETVNSTGHFKCVEGCPGVKGWSLFVPESLSHGWTYVAPSITPNGWSFVLTSTQKVELTRCGPGYVCATSVRVEPMGGASTVEGTQPEIAPIGLWHRANGWVMLVKASQSSACEQRVVAILSSEKGAWWDHWGSWGDCESGD